MLFSALTMAWRDALLDNDGKFRGIEITEVQES